LKINGLQKYFLEKLINVEYKLEEKKIFIKKLIYNAVQKTDSINKWNIQVSSLIYLLIINERIYKPNEIQKKIYYVYFIY
jgi:hypothetical protein